MRLRRFGLWSIASGAMIGVFSAEPIKKSSPGVTPLADPAGLHNLFALGTNLFSGSAPEGKEGFAALAKLGVRTIISVDGVKPDLDRAKQYGLRYVHLPHGYDGIDPTRQAQIVKAVETLPGPFYVHCHHGKHRGPAAVAVICLAESGWTPAQAEAWLGVAGTATNYVGLYEVARNFCKPSAELLSTLSPDFPESSQVSGLTETMVDIDTRWDHLKAVRSAGYQAPKDHPDIDSANEAVILWEHFREAQRLPESIRHGANFLARLNAAEIQIQQAEIFLRAYSASPKLELQVQLDQSFTGIAESCVSCHQVYRDPAGMKGSSVPSLFPN